MVFIDQISICIYVHCRHQVAKLFMVVWFFRRENAGSFIKRHLAINVLDVICVVRSSFNAMAPTVEKLIDYNRAMYAGIIGSKLTEML